MSEYIWLPLGQFSSMTELEMLQNIYILLFIWFCFWGFLKTITFLTKKR